VPGELARKRITIHGDREIKGRVRGDQLSRNKRKRRLLENSRMGGESV